MPLPMAIDDPINKSRLGMTWEHPKGFKSPLVRVSLEHGDEFNVSARMLPLGKAGNLFLQFLENLTSLGPLEERTFSDGEKQFEISCRSGSREVKIIVCLVSLASDWDDHLWRITVRLEIEVSRLPTIIKQFREFLAQEASA
jgi:hypothetical protein